MAPDSRSSAETRSRSLPLRPIWAARQSLRNAANRMHVAGVMIAAISPGLIDTGASRPWLDMKGARSPGEAAKPLVDFACESPRDPAFYGELVHLGEDDGRFGFKSLVPWK